MRLTQASAMPKRRARLRCAGGKRLTEMAMNTRLSTPSTISSVLNVTSAIQICGSASQSRVIAASVLSQVPRPEDQSPGRNDGEHADEDRRRSHVLRATGQLVMLGAIALDDRFDRR